MDTAALFAARIGRCRCCWILPIFAIICGLCGAFVIPFPSSPSPVERGRVHPSPAFRAGLASQLLADERRCSSGRRSARTSSLRAEQKRGETEYIDDCFGLIFLSGSFVAQDAVFSATFVALSAVALVATRANRIVLQEVTPERQRRVVPAVVAAATLVLTPVLEILVAPVYAQDLDDKARLIELAVCTVSVAYGFLSRVGDGKAD